MAASHDERTQYHTIKRWLASLDEYESERTDPVQNLPISIQCKHWPNIDTANFLRQVNGQKQLDPPPLSSSKAEL